MLDPYVRTLIDPPLNTLGKCLVGLGVSPNFLTFLGFGAGLLAMGMVVSHQYLAAAIFMLINRLLDGLDGAVARSCSISDFGSILDISCDFIIYAGLVFAFGSANPDHLFYATFLIFSFIGPITTFLAYAIIAAKRQVNTKRRGIKSFYHLGGICEGTETAFILLLICIYPEIFPWVCLIYGSLCWLTTIGRLYQAWADFGENSSPVMKPFIKDRQ